MQHKTDICPPAVFEHRSYYVNFASHLLNSWNANMMHANAGNRWGAKEFAGLLDMIKAFGFTCFEYWLEPTVYKTALNEDEVYRQFVETMQQVNDLAHARVSTRKTPSSLSDDDLWSLFVL